MVCEYWLWPYWHFSLFTFHSSLLPAPAWDSPTVDGMTMILPRSSAVRRWISQPTCIRRRSPSSSMNISNWKMPPIRLSSRHHNSRCLKSKLLVRESSWN